MTVVMILASYLLFVQRIGPQFMSNRKPYQLRSILICYNLLQVIFNFYTAVYGFYYSYWQSDFDYAGYNHYNETTTIAKHTLANICYFYFWTKIFDLFDTVFFVLRKKSNQISFLHLYHHCTMIFVEFIHNKYFAGNKIFFLTIAQISHFFLLFRDKNINFRESLYVPPHHQQFCSYNYVQLLLPHDITSEFEEIPLVEETYNWITDGMCLWRPTQKRVKNYVIFDSSSNFLFW